MKKILAAALVLSMVTAPMVSVHAEEADPEIPVPRQFPVYPVVFIHQFIDIQDPAHRTDDKFPDENHRSAGNHTCEKITEIVKRKAARTVNRHRWVRRESSGARVNHG